MTWCGPRKRLWEPKQRIIIPKGLIPPNQVTVIEVPRSLRGNAVCIAERKQGGEHYTAGRMGGCLDAASIPPLGVDSFTCRRSASCGSQPAECGTQTVGCGRAPPLSCTPPLMPCTPPMGQPCGLHGMTMPVGRGCPIHQAMYYRRPDCQPCVRLGPNESFFNRKVKDPLPKVLPTNYKPLLKVASKILLDQLMARYGYPKRYSEDSIDSYKSENSDNSRKSNKSQPSERSANSKKSGNSKRSDNSKQSDISNQSNNSRRSKDSMNTLQNLINTLNEERKKDLEDKEKQEKEAFEKNLENYQLARRRLFDQTSNLMGATYLNEPTNASLKHESHLNNGSQIDNANQTGNNRRSSQLSKRNACHEKDDFNDGGGANKRDNFQRGNEQKKENVLPQSIGEDAVNRRRNFENDNVNDGVENNERVILAPPLNSNTNSAVAVADKNLKEAPKEKRFGKNKKKK